MQDIFCDCIEPTREACCIQYFKFCISQIMKCALMVGFPKYSHIYCMFLPMFNLAHCEMGCMPIINGSVNLRPCQPFDKWLAMLSFGPF